MEGHGRYTIIVGMLKLEVERSTMGISTSLVRLVESPVIYIDNDKDLE